MNRSVYRVIGQNSSPSVCDAALYGTAEEKRGIIHRLRPDYQAKAQKELVLPASQGKPAKRPNTKSAKPVRATKMAWPKKMAERVQAVEAALHRSDTATPAELAEQFKRAKPAEVADILETLVTTGRARQQAGRFSR